MDATSRTIYRTNKGVRQHETETTERAEAETEGSRDTAEENHAYGGA